MINELKISEFQELEQLFPEVFRYNPVKEQLKNNSFRKFYTISVDKKIIGFICYDIIYDRAELININILKEYQDKKYGSKLIEFMFDDIKKYNVESITLEVKINNLNAVHLYEKYNFKKINIRKEYYNGIDGILMERKMIEVKDIYVLGIESSCDETSVSIIKNGVEEIATVTSTQIAIHKNFGGVVPEIASRQHVKNITIVLEACLEQANMTLDDIDLIAVTEGPGLIGSLLVGMEAAKTISLITKKPLIPVHHIAGHIYANNLVKRLEFPLICLVVSGGHTELIYMDNDYSFKKLGGTLDDAVGECYDKVARVLNIEYPGGPKLDNLAHIGKPTYHLPTPLDDDSYNFSFSGLKSAVINLAHNLEQKNEDIVKEDLATSFQDIVVSTISKKTLKALKEYNVSNLIVAGGVAANKGLRERLTEECEKVGVSVTFPEMKYCTDNAAMIATAGYYAFLRGDKSDLELSSKSTMELK